ncbi:CU044_5270 family protein [Actinomadura sp. WMMA1423]|uniref:CU044_5270 family protein n=1 Tax=Actinomadura sp. WMMA1423 TaxID=2591108 RepID=UPI00143DF287|nr:CU044_5270 family protein [Actinomadura sp. WMMA1423]
MIDELETVKAFYRQPAPLEPESAARMRGRLEEAARRRRPRIRKPLVLGLTAGVAAAGVAAVMVVSPARSPDGQKQAGPSARNLLLAAAHESENAAQTDGRYWHVRSESMGVGEMSVTEHDTDSAPMFRYQEICTSQRWVARSPRQPSWWIVDRQSRRWVSPSDEALWRRQGSPDIPPGCRRGGYMDQVTGAERTPYAQRLDRGSDDEPAPFPKVGTKTVSVEDILRLPSDPGRLKEVLYGWQDAFVASGGEEARQSALFDQASTLLLDLPTPPKVRAALYRLLADLPTARTSDRVRDPLGRAGWGVEMNSCDGHEGTRNQIILDERTGRLLATQTFQGCRDHRLRLAYTAVTKSGWSGELPRLPKNRAE